MAQSYDLDQAWTECLDAFAKTARVKLQPERILTPEDVLEQLHAKREHDEEASRKHQKLKQALGRVLTCVQKLGIIASQDQSGLLGPSNLVYCAIVVLIQAGDAFKMIYENLERLFMEVADLLERFDVYLSMSSEIDLPLKRIIHEMLQAMVSISSLSIKVLNGNKLVKYLKALAFNDDEGVRLELLRLRKLVEREASMNATLTYRYTKEGLQDANEGILGVRSVVDQLSSEMSKRDSDKLEQKQMDRIRTVLGVQKDLETQEALYRQFRNELVAGTGTWMHDQPAYQNWADIQSSSDSVLLLSGEHGYGKSFLCTSIIRGLQKGLTHSASLDSTARSAIAYYYIQSQDTKSSYGMDGPAVSVDQVLKTLAAQLAQNPVYRKALAAACEAGPMDDEESCAHLLDQCYRGTDVHFLVVDGLQAGEKQIKDLVSFLGAISSRFSPKQRSKVRIMVSGRALVMQDLSTKLNASGWPTVNIDLAKHSGQDLATFVRDRLDSMALLEGDSSTVKGLRTEVFTALVGTVKGDFVHASLLLKEISNKQWPSEIRSILQEAKKGGQRSDTIAREVARCNSVLSPQEIRDLNVLLLWVAAAGRSLTISELESVLYLSKGESSLRSIRDQIGEKYSAFFHLDENSGEIRVSLSSEPIRQYFAEASERDHNATQASSKIQESEIKIVRRFLASVCDEELYAKFGFDDFFARKLNSTTTLVHVDLESAGITLLSGCLQALTDPATESAQLIPYATANFAKHMAEVDLSMTSPIAKVECGKHLLRLFTKQDVIKRWWNINTLSSQTAWFYADDYVDLVLAFFRDTAITRTFDDGQRTWIKALTSKSSPDADLLEHIVRHLAHDLLSDPRNIRDLRTTISCLNAYRSMLLQRKDPGLQRTAQLKEYQMPPENIVKLFIWMADFLGEVDIGKSYAWNRCLATVLADFGHTDAAMAQFQVAIPMEDDNWECQLGLGIALRDSDEFAASNETLKKVEQQITSRKAQQNSPEKWLRDVRKMMGRNYRQLDQFEAALEVYSTHIRESKAKNLIDYGFTFDQIRILLYRAEYTAILDLIQTMRASTDPNFGIRQSSRLLHWICFDGDSEFILVETGKASGDPMYLRELLSEAVEDIHHPGYLRKQPKLRAYYRVILKWLLSEEMWRRAKTLEDKEETMKYWELLAQDAADVNDERILAHTTKRLATVYIQRMRDYDPESVEAQKLSKRALDLAIDDSIARDSWASVVSPRLLLARHLQLLGHDDQARFFAKGAVKTALDLLEDFDPNNDWEAHLRLALAMMYCGEDDNALAAWSLIWPLQITAQLKRTNSTKVSWPRLDDLESPSSDNADEGTADGSSETESSDADSVVAQRASKSTETLAVPKERYWEGPVDYECDGMCGKRWTYASSEIYVCKDCLDVMFCEVCLEKLRNDNLDDNICSAKHEFLLVPKFDADEALDRGQDHVRIKGTVVPVNDWLSQIRRDWGLEVTG